MPYQELIGGLNYTIVTTRPNIAYTISQLSSFHECYMPDHWSATVQVLCYLKGTKMLSLMLGSDQASFLIGYSDSGYANCIDTS